jgi:hypothetical protein
MGDCVLCANPLPSGAQSVLCVECKANGQPLGHTNDTADAYAQAFSQRIMSNRPQTSANDNSDSSDVLTSSSMPSLISTSETSISYSSSDEIPVRRFPVHNPVRRSSNPTSRSSYSLSLLSGNVRSFSISLPQCMLRMIIFCS